MLIFQHSEKFKLSIKTIDVQNNRKPEEVTLFKIPYKDKENAIEITLRYINEKYNLITSNVESTLIFISKSKILEILQNLNILLVLHNQLHKRYQENFKKSLLNSLNDISFFENQKEKLSSHPKLKTYSNKPIFEVQFTMKEFLLKLSKKTKKGDEVKY